MIVGKVYAIWDAVAGYKIDKVYADEESANIALEEHYNEASKLNLLAKVQTIDIVSYIKKETK